MGTEYNIANLFLQGFGLKVADSYGITQNEVGTGSSPIFSGMKVIESEDEAFEMSSFGTPIVAPIRFLNNTYKKYNKDGEIVPAEMGVFRLPIASIISFRRDKIMTETKINGGRGTVKEIYGFDDWRITINGFFIPEPKHPEGFDTPAKQEKELMKWENLASSIEVGCDLFTSRKIKYLTIKGVSVEPMRGRPNIRTFTIDALSDEPIELNIKSEI